DLAPDFDLAEQKRPITARSVAIVFSGTDHVSERIDAVGSHIAGSWLIRMPDAVFHKHAMQEIIASPQPTGLDHPPRPIRYDLSNTDALVLERSRKLVVIWVCGHRQHFPAALW